MDVTGNIGIAFLLATLAGLSTGIGSSIAYFIRKPKMIYLSFSLGFSAGVMIYISLDELLPTAHCYGYGHTVIIGMIAMALSLLLF